MASYLKHRSKIKSGDLLSWSTRSLNSWHDLKVQLVRLFTIYRSRGSNHKFSM